MRRRPTHDELKLIKENDELKTTIICLRHELANRKGHIERLRYLLVARLARIDELNSKLDQLRDQNRKLDTENEHLCEMMRLQPGGALGIS
jgi:chromosome segregation ATPase